MALVSYGQDTTIEAHASKRGKFSEENGLGSWGQRHKYVHMKFQIIK